MREFFFDIYNFLMKGRGYFSVELYFLFYYFITWKKIKKKNSYKIINSCI